MVTKTTINKLTRAILDSICKKHNVEIPKSVKTKVNLVDFMIKYSNWDPSLDEIIEEAIINKKPTRKAVKKKASAKKSVDTEVFEEITKKLEIQENEIKSFKILIKNELESKINSLKDELMSYINKQMSKVSSPTEKTKAFSSDIELKVIEAIPENEFIALDDIFEFLDDVSEQDFIRTIKRFLAFKIIEGEEGDSEIQVESFDGINVGLVKIKS